jgi:hypothetical protein
VLLVLSFSFARCFACSAATLETLSGFSMLLYISLLAATEQ